MMKPARVPAIRLRGVRHNNLKNFDLDVPLNQLVVITGLSGSGKSSLAFDTLFAEGQRRYIETFSPYARQFFDRMDKPQVDRIEGIPPAIAIEQRNSVKTTRSTVGTMTEICDYMKLLWPHIAQLHCRRCGQLVRKDSPRQVWDLVNTGGRMSNAESSEVLIAFDVPLSEKLSLTESLALIAKQGYQRILLDGQAVRLEDVQPSAIANQPVLRSPDPIGTERGQSAITVIQDRLKPVPANRARFVEACEQAYHFGKGKLAVYFVGNGHTKLKTQNSKLFSNRFHCAACDIEYREPSPALFSFNHPVGACPGCKGFGRVISIDYDLAVPDRSKTLAEGVVKPWQTGQGAECQADLLRMCRHFKIPTHVPFEKLPRKWQDFVIDGAPDYGKDEEHEWPRAWYGVKGYFRWLESKAYKMHVRVLLSRYRAYTTCPDCKGARFQPETLLYGLLIGDARLPIEERGSFSKPAITLASFYQLPIRDALALIEKLAGQRTFKPSDPIHLVLSEVQSRLRFLNDVGLGYLTLDRATRSLSGGETERVNLTTCLGTRLVNTLFVLDEPSVGLHPRDTERLVRILRQLSDAGNTVVVVEHEPGVMRAANQIIDLGPGHGATGGHVVFQGTYPEILKSKESLTGQYLSGRKRIEIPRRRPVNAEAPAPRVPVLAGAPAGPTGLALNESFLPVADRPDTCSALKLTHVTRHNLKDLTVEIPLGRFVCLTGVSGSGKTTLVREVLLPLLEAQLRSRMSMMRTSAAVKASERFSDPTEVQNRNGGGPDDEDEQPETRNSKLETRLSGHDHLRRVILVDQAILGKTPRSNPAVYIGAFDDIRELFAQSGPAKQRGLNASAFSFNSAQGQCQRCRGAGFEKIEMQFLSDVFIRCPDCQGRRYRQHILEVKCEGRSAKDEASGSSSDRARSIADVLEATVDEAIDFLSSFPDSRPAQRALESLRLLQEVGLGYLRLGQPINTLSGGESQRLKLVRHLAEANQNETPFRPVPDSGSAPGSGSRLASTGAVKRNENEDWQNSGPTLFLFDEPTTGLHFDDVRMLLNVFQRLVNTGHSVLVIEHNVDVIKCADWIIDLGPDAGDQGGTIVAQGTPECVAACPQSHTGSALKTVLTKTKPSGKEQK